MGEFCVPCSSGFGKRGVRLECSVSGGHVMVAVPLSVGELAALREQQTQERREAEMLVQRVSRVFGFGG